MELVWPLLGRPRLRSGRSVWVFLASGRFAAKAPAHEPRLSWISLDSLVRIETFQWVTRLQARKSFSRALSAALAALERELAVLACGRAGLFIEQA